MKQVQATIGDPAGLHARPAGRIVREAKQYKGSIRLQHGVREAEATKLLAVMSLGVKGGDTITITVEGPEEEATAQSMKQLLEALSQNSTEETAKKGAEQAQEAKGE